MAEMDSLNQELETLLTPLEKEAVEFVEKRHSESVLTRTQEDLRAQYAQTVPAVLREVERIRKQIGPALSRIGPALDALEREGVAGWHIAPVRVKLAALQHLLEARGLAEVPRMIERLEEDYCSVSGKPMGTAEILQRLAVAKGLASSINRQYESVVFEFGEAAKSKRMPRNSAQFVQPQRARPDLSRQVCGFDPLA